MSMIPSFIGKGFDQVAFVVEDLDSAQAEFRDLFGVDRWSVWQNQAKGQANKTYYGESEDFQFSCAYAYAGDMLIELCHHEGGRSVYKDWLDTKGPSLHHIGFRVADAAAFNDARAVYEGHGAVHAMGGQRPGLAEYAYYDTVKRLGCFTEIYWLDPSLLSVFARMKAGEIVEKPTKES